jgi:hypothetical protein
MATTTNYGWTTPDDTGLVKDGASAIRSLGTSVDTTTKNLNPSTTLGDIEYRSSTANTNTRLGIGSTGNVLTVAGGVPTWSAPAATGSEPVLLPTNSTFFVKTASIGAYQQAGAAEDNTFYIPIYLPAGTYDRISMRTGTSHTGTSTVRLGLYNVGTGNKPTTVKFDAGTVSASAASTIYSITISQIITAGYYYFAFNKQAQTGSGIFSYLDTPLGPGGAAMNTDIGNQYTNGFVFQEAGITGAFATAGTLSATNEYFVMGMRMA